MSERAKGHHRRTGHTTKLSYETWQRFREDLAFLRRTMSWRDISLAVGRNVGWAAKADEHRSVVDPRGIRDIANLARSKRAEASGITGAVGHLGDTGEIITVSALAAHARTQPTKEEQPMAATAAEPEKPVAKVLSSSARRYRGWVEALREGHGWTWAEIATAFGYDSPSGPMTPYQAGDAPPGWRMDRAEPIIDAMNAGRIEEAKRLCAKPRHIGDRDLLSQQLHTEDPVRRIGPPEPPPRPAPKQAPIPTPRSAAPPEAAVAAPSSKGPTISLPPTSDPFAGLLRVRVKIEEAVTELENLAEQVPAAFRAPWLTKRNELLDFLTTLE